MTYETDQRLKSYLDTNQLERERMCLAVLAADRRYSDVRPRHPRRGPDGARDIEALYQLEQRAFGAVGFVNQANDSVEHKRKIIAKFMDDLEGALKQTPKPEVFVFLTNVNLTVGEKDGLIEEAKKQGLAHSEIFDRERIRIVLDSADGLSLRFQYLGIPLSEAEQASFFAKWGDDIQGLINARFGALERTVNRIHFMQEASLPLAHLWVTLRLDREYPAATISHFRAFAYVQYLAPVQRVFALLFGCADNSTRNNATTESDISPGDSGILKGIAGAQWEHHFPEDADTERAAAILWGEEDLYAQHTTKVGSLSGAGRTKVKAITLTYSKSRFFRFDSGPRLIDLNGATFAVVVNESLASKIVSIQVFANDYKLAQFHGGEFHAEPPDGHFGVPMVFTAQELADKWMVLRPIGATYFPLDFAERTPQRFYSASEIPADPNERASG